MTFTRRYLDVADLTAYKALCVFENKLCIWDHGPNINDGQVLYTTTGALGSWLTLFIRTEAEIGSTSALCGDGMAVYNGSLFITQYHSAPSPHPRPRVIEWDGTDVTLHLDAPVHDNYMASNLLVWDNRLWCLTDVTPGFPNSKRVVYYYDGATWTPIIKYDGAANLTYVTGINTPAPGIKHRCSRLFVFGGELYLIATRWTGTIWAWEVWKFDEVAYDNFTKLYDSDAIGDGYSLAAIIEFEDKVKIVGNLRNGTSPGLPGKLYTSSDMVNWTLEATQATMGFPYGEEIFEGKFYLNCVNVPPGDNRTRIKHWDGRLGEFTLDQEIATNALITGGDLTTFNADIYAGKYMEIYGEPGSTPIQTRLKKMSMPGIEMNYKDPEGNVQTKLLAPIDTRAPTRFYEGRIKQLSSLKRAVDDKTGLFQIADMSMTLANADKEFSRLLATHIFKNQIVKLYHIWTDRPEAMRTKIITMIIEDHSIKGPHFNVKFKDITQKYFTKKVPENICTSDDFPDIHPDHEGRCMPEILGNASLSADYEHPGAVEAVYTDTENDQCLAAAGELHLISEVFVDDVSVDFTVPVIVADGHTYIDLDADPGDNPTITFNCEGYLMPTWNSPNGYIQNLAYIIRYFLRYIMEIPASLINAASFLTLAGYYEDMGVDQNCYLILQDRVDAMEVLRELLFTGGAKGFMAMDGKFDVQRKNICNWQVTDPDRHIFEQIELFGSLHRKWNLISAINTVNVEYGLSPWQNLYTGAKGEYRDNHYERPMEDDIRRERRRD